MVKGMDVTKVKKKPWKSRLERDIMLHKDLSESYTQGGKALGEAVDKLFKKKEKDNKTKQK